MTINPGSNEENGKTCEETGRTNSSTICALLSCVGSMVGLISASSLALTPFIMEAENQEAENPGMLVAGIFLAGCFTSVCGSFLIGCAVRAATKKCEDECAKTTKTGGDSANVNGHPEAGVGAGVQEEVLDKKQNHWERRARADHNARCAAAATIV